MTKEYIGSDEHWEDSINGDYDEKERIEKEQKRQIEKQINNQIEKELYEQCNTCRFDNTGSTFCLKCKKYSNWLQ